MPRESEWSGYSNSGSSSSNHASEHERDSSASGRNTSGRDGGRGTGSQGNTGGNTSGGNRSSSSSSSSGARSGGSSGGGNSGGQSSGDHYNSGGRNTSGRASSSSQATGRSNTGSSSSRGQDNGSGGRATSASQATGRSTTSTAPARSTSSLSGDGGARSTAGPGRTTTAAPARNTSGRPTTAAQATGRTAAPTAAAPNTSGRPTSFAQATGTPSVNIDPNRFGPAVAPTVGRTITRSSALDQALTRMEEGRRQMQGATAPPASSLAPTPTTDIDQSRFGPTPTYDPLTGRTRMAGVTRPGEETATAIPERFGRVPGEVATEVSPLAGRTRMQSVSRAISSPVATPEERMGVPPAAEQASAQRFTPRGLGTVADVGINPDDFTAGIHAENYREREAAQLSAANEGRADLAQQARADENASMTNYNDAAARSAATASRADLNQARISDEASSLGKLGVWGKEVKSVVDAGAGWTTVELNDGTVEKRSGLRSVRNNNPGNLEMGPRARRFGAVGDDSRFAVFASMEDGLAAQADLLSEHAKKGSTIAGMLSTYAPSFENNTEAYADAVADAIGVGVDTKMSDLSPQQMTDLARAMHEVEGVGEIERETVQAATKGYDELAGYYGANTPAPSAPASSVPTPTSRPAATDTPTSGEEPATGVPAENLANPSLPMRAPKPTAKDAPPYKRSGFGTAMATGIDLAISAVPLSWAGQVLSYITTGTSIGGNFADAQGGKFGMNYYQPGEALDPKTGRGGMAERGAGGYGSSTEGGRNPKATASGGKKASGGNGETGPAKSMEDDFIDKYISTDEYTQYMTPAEKWYTPGINDDYGMTEYGRSEYT